MKFNQVQMPASKLTLAAAAESFCDIREPPLFVGNWAMLNSGGPRLLVVEASDDSIVVAWKNNAGVTHERKLPRACLHRA